MLYTFGLFGTKFKGKLVNRNMRMIIYYRVFAFTKLFGKK